MYGYPPATKFMEELELIVRQKFELKDPLSSDIREQLFSPYQYPSSINELLRSLDIDHTTVEEFTHRAEYIQRHSKGPQRGGEHWYVAIASFLAGSVASGIAGNAAYDALKQSAKALRDRWRERHNSGEAHQIDEEEAIEIAFAAMRISVFECQDANRPLICSGSTKLDSDEWRLVVFAPPHPWSYMISLKPTKEYTWSAMIITGAAGADSARNMRWLNG
jgi:hypothetical protein